MTTTPTVCVVTGASRGLGRSVAEHLAERGHSLALCARSAGDLEHVVDELRHHNVEVFSQAMDVTDREAVVEFARLTEHHLGPASGLINNAGQLGPVGRIDTVPLQDWKDAFDANVMGVVNMTSAFVPQMTALGGGAIVNLLGGGIGGPGVQSFISAYTTAKGAIAVWTETIARELETLRIRVNALSPGALATGLMRPVLDAGPDIAGNALYQVAAAIYSTDQSASMLTPETAALIDYLISERSARLTGRLLSARWDSVEQLDADVEELIATNSQYTLRRIDQELFGQLER